jgi:hypothetical protein
VTTLDLFKDEFPTKIIIPSLIINLPPTAIAGSSKQPEFNSRTANYLSFDSQREAGNKFVVRPTNRSQILTSYVRCPVTKIVGVDERK